MSAQLQAALGGRRVLVTGAGVGIGRGIALACGHAGADVVLHCVDELDGAHSAAEEIRALGRRAEVIVADFRRLEAVTSLAQASIAALGGIDVLINNAGITVTRPFADVDAAFFDTVMAVNLRAPFFLTQSIAQDMARRGSGVVIHLASLHAFLGRREHAAYAASKGALVALTSQLAVELGPRGIRVVAIAPGHCIGEHQRAFSEPEALAAAGRSLPAGYLSQPEEIGRLAVFLASDAGAYFVGQTLRFDGGFSVLFPNVLDHQAPIAPGWGERYLAD